WFLGWVDRWLADIILPGWMLRDRWAIRIDLPAKVESGPVQVTADPMIRGQRTGIILTGASAPGAAQFVAPGDLTIADPALSPTHRQIELTVVVRPGG